MEIVSEFWTNREVNGFQQGNIVDTSILVVDISNYVTYNLLLIRTRNTKFKSAVSFRIFRSGREKLKIIHLHNKVL